MTPEDWSWGLLPHACRRSSGADIVRRLRQHRGCPFRAILMNQFWQHLCQHHGHQRFIGNGPSAKIDQFGLLASVTLCYNRTSRTRGNTQSADRPARPRAFIASEKAMERLVETIDAKARLTRRLLVGLAAIAPFAAREALASKPCHVCGSVVRGPGFFRTREGVGGQGGGDARLYGPAIEARGGILRADRMPMATCPFCDSEATWPKDIVLVMLARPAVHNPIVARSA